MRGAELEACQRLLEVLERRAAVLGLLQEALDPDRTVVRVGPELEGEELRGASYVGTTYGLANRSLGTVGLLGPLRMRLRRAIPSGPCGGVRAFPTRRRRLRACLMATTEQDYYELLGVSRNASHDEIKRAFRQLARELHPDVSAAPEADLRFRAVAEAYEVLSDAEAGGPYDRFGHAGRRGGFAPVDADFGSLSDVFAAFFGESLFGRGRAPARARRAAPMLPRTSRSTSPMPRRGRRRAFVRAARAAGRAGAPAPPPGRHRPRVPAAAAPAASSR